MTTSRPSPVSVQRQPPGPVRGTSAWRSTQAQREVGVLSVIAAGGLAVIGVWWVNNPGNLHTFADRLTAAGRISGLLGTYLVLVQVALMARMPWLDRWIGTDRLTAWHRSNGQYTIGMLVAHTLLITGGYASADRTSLAHEAVRLLRYYPDVLAATAAWACSSL